MGYIGLIPWNAKTGDEVWVLKGGKTPFLLRRTEGIRMKQKTRMLVGETYIQGIIGDEILKREEPLEYRSLRLI